MDSTRKATWVALLSLGVLSCAHAAAERDLRRFQVEAYRGIAHAPHLLSYRLTCEAADSPEVTAIVAASVRAALAGKGLHEVSSGDVADLTVSVTFQVAERVESASPFLRRFRPVTHRVRTIDVPVADADGTVRRRPQEIMLAVDDGYVAWNSERRTVTKYAKSLEISARAAADPTSGISRRELWRVRVSNKDETADPDTYARLMVAAALPYIAARTDGREAISVRAVDARERLAGPGD